MVIKDEENIMVSRKYNGVYYRQHRVHNACCVNEWLLRWNPAASFFVQRLHFIADTRLHFIDGARGHSPFHVHELTSVIVANRATDERRRQVALDAVNCEDDEMQHVGPARPGPVSSAFDVWLSDKRTSLDECWTSPLGHFPSQTISFPK